MAYFLQVEEAEEQAELTKQPPSYPPAPKLLILYNRLQRWNTLPLQGGYLDQPCLLMEALNAVHEAIQEHQQIRDINQRLAEQVIGQAVTTQGLPVSKG